MTCFVDWPNVLKKMLNQFLANGTYKIYQELIDRLTTAEIMQK